MPSQYDENETALALNADGTVYEESSGPDEGDERDTGADPVAMADGQDDARGPDDEQLVRIVEDTGAPVSAAVMARFKAQLKLQGFTEAQAARIAPMLAKAHTEGQQRPAPKGGKPRIIIPRPSMPAKPTGPAASSAPVLSGLLKWFKSKYPNQTPVVTYAFYYGTGFMVLDAEDLGTAQALVIPAGREMRIFNAAIDNQVSVFGTNDITLGETETNLSYPGAVQYEEQAVAIDRVAVSMNGAIPLYDNADIAPLGYGPITADILTGKGGRAYDDTGIALPRELWQNNTDELEPLRGLRENAVMSFEWSHTDIGSSKSSRTATIDTLDEIPIRIGSSRKVTPTSGGADLLDLQKAYIWTLNRAKQEDYGFFSVLVKMHRSFMIPMYPITLPNSFVPVRMKKLAVLFRVRLYGTSIRPPTSNRFDPRALRR